MDIRMKLARMELSYGSFNHNFHQITLNGHTHLSDEGISHILALIEETGYVELPPDGFVLTGLSHLKEMARENQETWQAGYVKLAEDQSLPPFIYVSSNDLVAKRTIQQDMLKQGWRKVKIKDG